MEVPESIEEGRAASDSDFVTILQRASMRYISLSYRCHNTSTDARGRTVKTPPVHKIVLRGLYQNLQPISVL
jgi:hypothetical protein